MRTVAVAPGRAAVGDHQQPRRPRRPGPATTGSCSSTRPRLTVTLLLRIDRVVAPPRRHGSGLDVPVTVARRAARRSVVSTAGPSTTIATALVIARPVSQLPVEVSSV